MTCTLPPLSYLAGCGEAAAGSTVLELRWPPALRTEPLSPGGRRPSPGPTARPSHRNGPLHGTSPSPGGPEQEEGGRARCDHDDGRKPTRKPPALHWLCEPICFYEVVKVNTLQT